MKKLLYPLTMLVAALAVAACSDQNDVVNDLIDEVVNRPPARQFPYTLESADYTSISDAATKAAGDNAPNKALAAAVKSTNSLNSFAGAGTYVPAVLAAKYPALGRGSAIQVTYSYTEDRPEYLSRLSAEPSTPIVMENFELYANPASPYETWDKNGWTHTVTKGGGTKYWQIRAYSGNKYAQVTANGGVAEQTEVYVVSPAITLDKPTGNHLSFDVCVGYWNAAGLSVLIAQASAASVVTSPAQIEWTDVTSNFTIPVEPASGYGVLAPAGSMNLDAYAGKSIHIAFRYDGETGMGNPNRTTTYQIDNVKVANGDPTVTPVAGAAYIDDGERWSLYPDGVSLTAADYAAMGLTSLSAAQAPGYLPQLLARKFPYAQPGDKKAVIYSAGTDEYAFAEGKWYPTATPVNRTEQFIYGDSGWIFDPTVNVTMDAAEFQIAVTAALSDPATSMYTNLGRVNEEWYYGFNAYYRNVSFNLASRAGVASSKANDTELYALEGNAGAQVKLLWKRLIEKGMPLYLATRWPGAVSDVQGVEVLYKIGTAVYYPDGVTNVTTTYTLVFRVKAAGSPPSFEYVEGAPTEFYP